MGLKKFKNIVLLGRPGFEAVPQTLQALADYLHTLDVNICVETNTASMMGDHDLPVVNSYSIPEHIDLIIVVGGDGSLLNASHIALQHDLPVLGINRGRLGFLTDIHPDEIEKVGDVLRGEYFEEKRFLLEAELEHDGQIFAHDIGLNDIVLLPGDIAHMIEFETMINDQFVCSQRADGLIVASPTGSTAYALSGGGPILHPQLDAIVLVPMFPHTLSSRPVVVDGNSRIEIHISPNNIASPYVSSDGMSRVALPPGGKLFIKKKPEHLHLIHPKDYNYFTTLREKLGWETHAKRSNNP